MTLFEIVEDEILQALERGAPLPDYFTIRIDDETPVSFMPQTEILVEVAGVRARVVLESLLLDVAEEQ